MRFGLLIHLADTTATSFTAKRLFELENIAQLLWQNQKRFWATKGKQLGEIHFITSFPESNNNEDRAIFISALQKMKNAIIQPLLSKTLIDRHNEMWSRFETVIQSLNKITDSMYKGKCLDKISWLANLEIEAGSFTRTQQHIDTLLTDLARNNRHCSLSLSCTPPHCSIALLAMMQVAVALSPTSSQLTFKTQQRQPAQQSTVFSATPESITSTALRIFISLQQQYQTAWQQYSSLEEKVMSILAPLVNDERQFSNMGQDQLRELTDLKLELASMTTITQEWGNKLLDLFSSTKLSNPSIIASLLFLLNQKTMWDHFTSAPNPVSAELIAQDQGSVLYARPSH